MIVWGSGGDSIKLGAVETRRCERCERERRFQLVLQYRYWGIYWIFNFVTEKQYTVVCDTCEAGRVLNQREAERNLKSVPIPFMRRYGFLAFLVLIVAVILYSSLG